MDTDNCISSLESNACFDYCLGLIGNKKAVPCFEFQKGCKARYNPETRICELTIRQKNGVKQMGRLSLTASTANVNPANTVGIESLDRIEKLMVERFATTQSMIFKNAKALDALALEISLIKASVKEMRLGMENLTAAISIHAAVNKPAPAMKASEPVKADSGNALADLINNALDFTALRAIAKDNKPRFDDIVLARNTAQWDKSKLSNNLEAAKVNMLSKLAGTSAKANESVKENPVESWSKQLKLSADLLKQIVESVRKNGFQESDKEEIGEFLGHNNLPIAFFAWLKSVSESARK